MLLFPKFCELDKFQENKFYMNITYLLTYKYNLPQYKYKSRKKISREKHLSIPKKVCL